MREMNVTVSDFDHDRARELICQFGWNATAYQILNPGIDLWFSSMPVRVAPGAAPAACRASTKRSTGFG